MWEEKPPSFSVRRKNESMSAIADEYEENAMKRVILFFAGFALALAMGMAFGALSISNQAYGGGYGYGKEAAGMTQEKGRYCETEFQQWDAGKGYLTEYDFRDAYAGQSQKGLAPVGRDYSLFRQVDRDGDNRVSVAEFCEWKAG